MPIAICSVGNSMDFLSYPIARRIQNFWNRRDPNERWRTVKSQNLPKELWNNTKKTKEALRCPLCGIYYVEVKLTLHLKIFAEVNTHQTMGYEREPVGKE